MKVEMEVDEVWTLLYLIVDQVLEEAGLTDEDRARIKRWRSEEMKRGSETMKVLTQKSNEDLAKLLLGKEHSLLLRPDWR